MAISQVVMFTAMAYRHPPLYEHSDHALWYYPLPLQAFITALCVPLLARLLPDRPARRLLLNLVLLAIVIANVSQWQRFERQQRHSHWFNFVYTQTGLLKLSMCDGRPSRLRPGYLEFYQFVSRAPRLCGSGPKRAGSIVAR